MDNPRDALARYLSELYRAANFPPFDAVARKVVVPLSEIPGSEISSRCIAGWFERGRVPREFSRLAAVLRVLIDLAGAEAECTPGLLDLGQWYVWWLDARRTRSDHAEVGGAKVGEGSASHNDVARTTVSGNLLQAASIHGDVYVRSSERQLPRSEANQPSRAPTLVNVSDPRMWGVHPAIAVPGQESSPPMPRYIPRSHDEYLQQIVASAKQRSRFVVLVGETCTGKTRALVEAVQQLQDWRVWQPAVPSPARALLLGLTNGQLSPRTVIWLDDLRRYLHEMSQPQIGNEIAEQLRELVHDPHRGPVLVVATLLPHEWERFTRPPSPGPAEIEEGPNARALLMGNELMVPGHFTATQLVQLRTEADRDPRLREALRYGENRVTQFLAGGVEQARRCDIAPPIARALITAAMDARRLGHSPDIPASFLREAAPGYLRSTGIADLPDNWFDDAVGVCCAPCLGLGGVFSRGRSPVAGDVFRLAEYLVEQARHQRATEAPPREFWHAARQLACMADVRALADAADSRGRWQLADQLYRRASELGDNRATGDRARMLERAQRLEEARYLYEQASLQGDTSVLSDLAVLQENTGDLCGAERTAAHAATVGDPTVYRKIAEIREESGVRAARHLYEQAAEAGDPSAYEQLTMLLARSDLAACEETARRAAEAGNFQPLLRLADSDLNGAPTLNTRSESQGLKRQPDRGRRLLNWAAERGHVPSLRRLARLHEANHDNAAAERYFQKAADSGDTSSRRALADLHEKRKHIDRAEQLYLAGLNNSDISALHAYARTRSQQCDHIGAEQIRAYGVDAEGRPSAPWRPDDVPF